MADGKQTKEDIKAYEKLKKTGDDIKKEVSRIVCAMEGGNRAGIWIVQGYLKGILDNLKSA